MENDYRKDRIYVFSGFSCGAMLGDGCERRLDGNVNTAFDGIVFKGGKLRAAYIIINPPHICPECGKESTHIYSDYQYGEAEGVETAEQSLTGL